MKDHINTISTTTEAHNYYEQGYKQGRADGIEPFEELYKTHICIEHNAPTMPMLMDFYNQYKLIMEKVKEQL